MHDAARGGARQIRLRGARRARGTEQVNLDELQPVLVGINAAEGRGIVDQHINAAERGGSFGDRRIDVAAMSSAIASLPSAELALRIDRLAAWRGTVPEPALAARVDRAMARRLLAADGVDVAGSPTLAFQVASLFAAAPHLRDMAQEMRLAGAGFAASAGLADAARATMRDYNRLDLSI
jgi:hypothetical protein